MKLYALIKNLQNPSLSSKPTTKKKKKKNRTFILHSKNPDAQSHYKPKKIPNQLSTINSQTPFFLVCVSHLKSKENTQHAPHFLFPKPIRI